MNVSVPGYMNKWAKCAQTSNWRAPLFAAQKLAHGQSSVNTTTGGRSSVFAQIGIVGTVKVRVPGPEDDVEPWDGTPHGEIGRAHV